MCVTNTTKVEVDIEKTEVLLSRNEHAESW